MDPASRTYRAGPTAGRRVWGVRRVLAALLLVAASSALAAPPSAAPAAPPPPPGPRQAELLNLLRNDCGACHGGALTGGVGPSLKPAAIAGKPDSALAAVILDGVPGTPMPPWAPFLSAGEVAWLVGRLREGALNAP